MARMASIMLFLVLLAFAAPAAAQPLRTGGGLPEPREAHALVWVSGSGYVVGGASLKADLSGSHRPLEILRLAEGGVIGTGLELPRGRSSFAHAVVEGRIYLFGGMTEGEASHEILKVDPVEGTVQVLEARLPSGRTFSTAAVVGTDVYLFGGWESASDVRDVLRFDTRTDMLHPLDVRLPEPRWGAVAAYDGKLVHLVGGSSGTTFRDNVILFDPERSVFLDTARKLPWPMRGMAAGWDGDRLILFGGAKSTMEKGDEILVYRPRSFELSIMHSRLPAQSSFGAASWNGDEFQVVGGTNLVAGRPVPSGAILHYSPDEDEVESRVVLSETEVTPRRTPLPLLAVVAFMLAAGLQQRGDRRRCVGDAR